MTNILIAIVVLLLIATLVQILRVSELLSEIKNKDVNEVTDEDNNTQGILFLIVGFGFLIFVVWQMAAWNHLLLPPASIRSLLQPIISEPSFLQESRPIISP